MIKHEDWLVFFAIQHSVPLSEIDTLELNIGRLGLLFKMKSTPEHQGRIAAWNSKYSGCRACHRRLATLLHFGTSKGPLLLSPRVFAKLAQLTPIFDTGPFLELQEIAADIYRHCEHPRLITIPSLFSNEKDDGGRQHWSVNTEGRTCPELIADKEFQRLVRRIIDGYINTEVLHKLHIDLGMKMPDVILAKMRGLELAKDYILPFQLFPRFDPSTTLEKDILRVFEFVVNSPYARIKGTSRVRFYWVERIQEIATLLGKMHIKKEEVEEILEKKFKSIK